MPLDDSLVWLKRKPASMRQASLTAYSRSAYNPLKLRRSSSRVASSIGSERQSGELLPLGKVAYSKLSLCWSPLPYR